MPGNAAFDELYTPTYPAVLDTSKGCKIDLSADESLIFFLFFFPDNRLGYFMQVVSKEDNLHEMQKSVFWEN